MHEESGDVYVVDRGNNRVNVFDPGGNFRFAWGWGVADGFTAALQRCGPEAVPPTTPCFAGIPGAGAGQFESPTYIAIDNSGGPSDGDVYVGTDNFRVQRFDSEGHFLLSFGSKGTGDGQFNERVDPIAVGPDSTVYICDSRLKGSFESEGYIARVEKFDTSGAFIESLPIETEERNCYQLVVDSTGDIYVVNSRGKLHKYDSNGSLLYTLDPGISTYAIAVDAADHIFAVQEPAEGLVITEYDSAGTKLSRFGYGEIPNLVAGLAVQSSTGTLFGALPISDKALRFTPPPSGPVIVPVSVIANPVGNAKATVNGKINPEGKPTTYHFDYITEAQYQANGGSFGAGTISTPESASIGSDFELYSASAGIGCPDPVSEAGQPGSKCLVPETEFRFRVVAKDSEGRETTAEGAPFTTLAPLEILSTFATEVGTDSAKLQAEVNPLGIPASGRFEYVEDAKYQESGFAEAKQSALLDFGSGEVGVKRSVFLAGLSLAITYHYRIIVDGLLSEPLVGLERTFTTQSAPRTLPSPDPCPNAEFRTGASANLPDCRAYELVSPIDKDNSDVAVALSSVGYPAQLNQGAIGGEKLTYSTYRAFGDPQSAPYISQYLAIRDPGTGWQSKAISPPRGVNITGTASSLDTEFKAFSSDLCSGWLFHDTDPPLAPGAIEGFANFYEDDLCDDGGFETQTRTDPPPNRSPKEFRIEAQGISADGSTSIFRANDALTANAPDIPTFNTFLLYGSRNGAKPKLICVLPGGTPIGLSGCSAGTGTQDSQGEGRAAAVAHAISSDGSRVFWTAADKTSAALYVRENPFGSGTECSKANAPCTVAVSGSVTNAEAQFWTAAADGSKAIFTIVNGPFKDNLYEFDVETKTSTLIAPQVKGVLVGASEDASRIYFASKALLTGGEENSGGEKAQAGEPNLYLYETTGGGGSFAFVAGLSEADALSGTGYPSPVSLAPIMHLARVSPDGRHLVFMSTAPLLGYDNTDAVNGEADHELYTYEAGGELHCVSCNPTGARPVGGELRFTSQGSGVWAAAKVPAAQNQLYAPRVITEDGQRLFFESTDALLARDTNGRQDVYEWLRADGEEECEEAGAELYVAKAGGCLGLISTGQSPTDTALVDISADGTDVFIATGASLLPQDPGLVDIYVARAGGGFPPSPTPPAACEGEACQGPLTPPDDPTPASSAFQGAGNVAEGKGAKPRCRKSKVRRKGRCVTRKAQRAKNRPAKRNGRAGR